MTYQDQIKSPKWQKKRLEVMEINRFKCEECQCEDTQLNVHHTYYRKGHKIWEYDNVELRCLCEDCHKKTHELNENILASLGVLEVISTMGSKEQVLGYIHGMLSSSDVENPSESYMEGYIQGTSNVDISERFRVLVNIFRRQS
jgi:hypothetical protein